MSLLKLFVNKLQIQQFIHSNYAIRIFFSRSNEPNQRLISSNVITKNRQTIKMWMQEDLKLSYHSETNQRCCYQIT